MPRTVKDTDWVRRSFMLPTHSLISADMRRSLTRNVAMKFTDTTLGGNFAINPPPQYTRHADLKVKSQYSNSRGMGRYYSESIDDNAHHIHLSFGVPAFNSLTQFFTNYYNPQAGSLARTGRGKSIFYTMGQVAGFVVTAPLLPIILAGRAIRFFTGNSSSKFYSLKPTMPLYWNAVNNIANGIAVSMGIVPRVFSSLDELGNAASPNYNRSDIAAYHRMLPDLYRPNGGIDIYALANRTQRLADRHRREMMAELESASSFDDLRKRMTQFATRQREGSSASGFEPAPGSNNSSGPSIDNYMAAWESVPASMSLGEGEDTSSIEDSGSWYNKIIDFSAAELRDGSRFITLKVNGEGSVSESFSNSTKESELANAVNSMSSSARSKRFSFAGGNIGSGVVQNLVEGFIGATTDFVAGALDTVGLSGLAALAGSAFVDIPKQWDSSSASFPSSSYTIELRSPYGNKMSRFMNLYVPLAMLLAGTLPLSTGRHSYTSPFLCELYSRGRNQIRLGMIDSLEITRGVGNLGWTAEGEPLGIDISVSILDLSSIMHMPLSSKTEIFGEDTAFTDYLATLGSLSLTDQIYPTKKMALNLTRRLTEFQTWASPSHFSNWAMGTLPGRVVSGFARTTIRGDAGVN